MKISQLNVLTVLYIPVHIIWKIKIRWTQKAALTISLCLTVIMVILTITRVCGIKIGGRIDSTWETYWLILSAEFGIILTSVGAFRAFFVSRVKSRRDRGIHSPPKTAQWYHHKKTILKRTFITNRKQLRFGAQASWVNYEANEDHGLAMGKLPDVPRAHITGIRTCVRGQDMTMHTSSSAQSQTTLGVGDTSPVHTPNWEFRSCA